MSYRTMTIAISDEEMQALNRLAMAEYRKPRDQARYLLRQVLLGERTLPDDPPTAENKDTALSAASL